MKTKKNIIIVADRVPIDLDEGSGKIGACLYHPPTVKERVQVGRLVMTVPGCTILLKGSAKEGKFEEKKYLIALLSAIPALVRTEFADESEAA
jgi:hypothetical protein